MRTQLMKLGARLRNLFQTGEFRRRYDDGRIQVQTHANKVVERAEAFPYGFQARAKNGRAPVICRGGNVGGFEILPLLPGDGVAPPELRDGDACLYTGEGGWVACRNDGTVELFGRDAGGVVKAEELKREPDKMTARIDAVISALRDSPTAPQDGGATFKAAIVAALNAIRDRENFAGIESEEVKHGTGG